MANLNKKNSLIDLETFFLFNCITKNINYVVRLYNLYNNNIIFISQTIKQQISTSRKWTSEIYG